MSTYALRPRFKPLAAALLLVAYGAVYGVASLLSSDTQPALLPLNLLFFLPPVAAVILCVKTGHSLEGPEARSWMLLGVFAGLMTAGDLVWTVGYTANLEAPGAFSASAILYSLAYIPLLWFAGSALASAGLGMPLLARLRSVLDMGIVTLLASIIAYVVFVQPLLSNAGPGELNDWLIGGTFSLLDITVFVALMRILVEARVPMWRSWQATVAYAMGVYASAEFLGAYLDLNGGYTYGTWAGALIETLWLSMYLLLVFAAVQRLSTMNVHPEPIVIDQARNSPRWYDYLLVLLLLVAAPAILFQARYGTMSDPEFWVLGGAASLVAIMVVARSVLLTSEYGRLLFRTVVDPLTNAYNFRYFHERLPVEIERARQSSESMSLIVLDIDDFTAVNERFGHSYGDECLRALADLLRRHEGRFATTCRLGQDAFAVILPATTTTTATEWARTIQLSLAQSPELFKGVESISFGIATFPVHALEPTTLLAKANGALYWAQVAHRGEILVFDEEVVEAFGPEERIRNAHQDSYMQVVETLAAAVDARDPYTQNHSREVARLAIALSVRLGLSEEHSQLVGTAALLHDVGKIGIPDGILRKPGPLTHEERLEIETHPELGERILGATVFQELLPWVRFHHERWDGQGYPEGLSGESIPLEARVLAICDSYDAMVSNRPYRSGFDPMVALQEIERCAGTQFDPFLTEEFVTMLLRGETPASVRAALSES